MLKIEPIKLLKGSHAETAQTGEGCFMNVIAYLNGEPQITDQSPCVCVTVKPIAIWLNDFLADGERHRMIPYIERAMGSATMEKSELVRRAWLCADLAKEMSVIAAESAASAESAAIAAIAAIAARAASAAESAAIAAWAAESAAWAAESAAWAASADYETAHQQIITACFAFLDKALPQAQAPAPEVVERAQRLVELA